MVAPSEATCERASRLSASQGVLALNSDLIPYARLLYAEGSRGPDIIHCHDWCTYPTARELGDEYGRPVIGTAHSTSEPVARWSGDLPDEDVLMQERSLYKECDILITVSASLKSIIASTHGILDEKIRDEKIRVIHNGFDTTQFASASITPDQKANMKRAIAKPDERIVLFAGRLTLEKGTVALFESAAKVVEQRKDVTYLIAGESGSLRSSQALEQLKEKYVRPGGKIKLLGRVERKQLAMLYQVADLAVAPSIYDSFGYAAVEAMAAGVAVVATRTGGLAEIIEDRKTGVLVPVYRNGNGEHKVDVERLTAAQIELLDDAPTRKRISEAGKRDALERFNLDRMVDSTVRLYCEVLSARK